jgi:hypothetical protein
MDVGGFGERLADDLQSGTDDREVATGPGGLLALFDGGEVGGDEGGFDDKVHGSLLKCIVGWPAWRAGRRKGGRRGRASTKPLFAARGVDTSPNILQICPCVRGFRAA